MRLFIFILFAAILFLKNIVYSNDIDNKVNIIPKYNDVIGQETSYVIQEKDTLIDVARKYGISFADIMSANGDIDPWLPKVNRKILIPKKHVVPSTKREGIVINLGDLRIYYYKNKKLLNTYPIGIGRSGWETPLGIAKVIDKKIDPYWVVPDSVREEDPTLPKVVAPGKDNPLGNRAIYLSIPSYLIHGTNKPYGVGMKVSHGCIRMYPEDVESLFNFIEVGTKVSIVDQPIKAGWKKNELFIEVHELPEYASESKVKNIKDRRLLYPVATEVVQKAAGANIILVDWDIVFKTVLEAKGIPVKISIR